MHFVVCKSCGLEAPTETGTGEDAAIRYWNTRAGHAQSPAHRVLTRWQEKLAHLEDMRARGDLTKDWGECSLISARNIVSDLTEALAVSSTHREPVYFGTDLSALADRLVGIQEDMPDEDHRAALGEAAHYLRKCTVTRPDQAPIEK